MAPLETICQNNHSSEIARSSDGVPKEGGQLSQHECACTRNENPSMGVKGRSYKYLFTRTPLGTVIHVIYAGGKKEDITDYSTW